MEDKNSLTHHGEIKELQTDKEISLNSLNQTINFYNDHQEVFLEFEKSVGINLWFLNHFRTYFDYRNKLLFKLKNSDTEPTNQDNIKNKLSYPIRISEEFLGMLIKFKRPHGNKTDNVIISNSTDIINHQNIRLGYFNYNVLDNRLLFDIKDKRNIKVDASNHNNTDNIFINYLFKRTFIRDLLIVRRHFKIFWNKLSNHQSSIDNSEYQTIYRSFTKNRLFFYIMFLRYKSLDMYFKKYDIKGILLSDENSPQQKVIQYAALNNGTNVYAFQHGNIHQLHPAYMYGRYKMKPLLPTITFTWGDFFTNLLINEGGYLKHSVKTIGRVPNPNHLKKLNPLINIEDNIILYISQPQRNYKIRYTLLADIMSVVKELMPLYTLVIRPHPNEKDDEFFNLVAKDIEFHDFIIDRESDLNTHCEICSMMLVAFSTVGTEFIQYYKPLLVLDYMNQDLLKWIEKGVGIPINNKQDLYDVLTKNKIEINEEKYRSFLREYYAVNDNIEETFKQAINEL